MLSGTERLAAALASKYRLLEELGRGGAATVYLAEDLRHPRRVAVKVLRQEFSARGSIERFLREIQIAAQLQHPHILPLLDSGEADGFLYFVMPHVEGETLRDRLRREGQLSVPDALRILSDVVDAVAHAHARGVVHRDIKPENILLSGRHALVTDFGVARALSAAGEGEEALTQGVAIGTPAYMAPEQATAEPGLDHRVDIYAIGVLAYELLAGRPPFSSGTAQDILTAHVVLTPEPVTSFRADAPPGLVTIIQRCLAKKPQDRFQEASALLEELDPLVTPSGGMTPAGSTPVSPLLQRPGVRWAGVGIAGFALGAVALAVLSRDAGPPTSGQWRQLTFRGDVVEVALSPDGQFLAYVSAAGEAELLLVQDLRGGGTLELAEGRRIRRLSWSGDGTEIRCVRALDSLTEYVSVPRLGGPISRLPSPGVFSPDGSLAATITTSEGRLVIQDLGSGDSTVIQVPVGADLAAGMSWSPRGDRLALRTISPLPGHASIYVILAAGGKVREVLRDSSWLTEPAWSPDASALYYLGPASPGVIALSRLGIASDGNARGRPETIATGLRPPEVDGLLNSRPSVGEDGRRVLYRSIDLRSNLARLAMDGPPGSRGLHLLTTGTARHPYARFSPDGRTIALMREEASDVLIGTMPVEGGEVRPVGRLSRAYELAWAPDGAELVVSGSMARDSAAALHVLPLSGGTPRRYVPGRVSYGMDWLPDGRIVHMQFRNRSFGMLDPRSGVDTTFLLPDTTGWVFWPRGNLQGTEIAYAWNPGNARLETWVAPAGGGTPRRISPDGWAPLRFSKDGRSLFAARLSATQDALEVAAFPLRGRGNRSLVTLPAGMRALDVSPDGRTLLLLVQEKVSDVWEVRFPER